MTHLFNSLISINNMENLKIEFRYPINVTNDHCVSISSHCIHSTQIALILANITVANLNVFILTVDICTAVDDVKRSKFTDVIEEYHI